MNQEEKDTLTRLNHGYADNMAKQFESQEALAIVTVGFSKNVPGMEMPGFVIHSSSTAPTGALIEALKATIAVLQEKEKRQDRLTNLN